MNNPITLIERLKVLLTANVSICIYMYLYVSICIYMYLYKEFVVE